MDPKLRAVVDKIRKEKGPGALILGSEISNLKVPRITSGSLGLDVILGGGWPANQWHEIIGQASAGKTMTVLKTIAANQERDPDWTVWWLASETFVESYARMCGVDMDRVWVDDTNVMEDGFRHILEVAPTRGVDCVVIDSLPALVPLREDVNESGELAPGLSALLINQFFRKQGSATRRSITEYDRPLTGFVINQWREKIGVQHGDSRTTPGGKGKDFAYVTRVETRRADWIKLTGDGEPVGMSVAYRTLKNKSHRPNRTCQVDFYFEDIEGHTAGSLDRLKEVVSISVLYSVVEARGAWLRYGGHQWQGRPSMYQTLLEDPELEAQISQEVLDAITQTARVNVIDTEPKPETKKLKVPGKKTDG